MKRFRIGNDIQVTWNVLKNGNPAELDGKTITLFLTHPRGREEIKEFSVSGNKISLVVDGLSQVVLGKYTLTIDARYTTGSRYLIQDKCNAFELVGRTCIDEAEETDYTVTL